MNDLSKAIILIICVASITYSINGLESNHKEEIELKNEMINKTLDVLNPILDNYIDYVEDYGVMDSVKYNDIIDKTDSLYIFINENYDDLIK